MMIFVNEFIGKGELPRQAVETYVKLLSPYAPHIAEELWEELGNNDTIAYSEWPAFDEKYLTVDEVEILVQILGKPCTRLKMPAKCTPQEMEELAMQNDIVSTALAGKTVRKVIAVPERLVNIVAN